MPRYIDSAGREVAASQALDNVGKIRPGFNQVLETGERAHFDIMMRDAAPRPMFFHDSEDPEKAFAAQQAQLSDQRRNAWKTSATAMKVADQSAAPVFTGDAEADFAEAQRQLSERRRNAWKGA